jgi:hypothetical protein
MLRTAFVLTLALAAGFDSAATIRVDITPGHAANTVVPVRALGAGVDGEPGGAYTLARASVSMLLGAVP